MERSTPDVAAKPRRKRTVSGGLSSLVTSTSGWVDKHSSWILHIGTFTSLGFVVLFPFLIVLGLSFTPYQLGLVPARWIGLENYVRLFSDERFLNAILHTLYFVAVAVSIELVVGLGLALLLNHDFRGKVFYRMIILLPMMSIPAAISMVWRMLYNRTFGIMSQLPTTFGFPPISWLGNEALSIPAVILVDIWQWSPFIMIILLAGLHSLPQAPFEAAVIDGASGLDSFRYITLPFLKPHILTAATLRSVLAFKTFDSIWIITEGGPSFSSEVLNSYLYSRGFLYFQLGYASAVGIAFFLIMLGFSVLQSRLISKLRS